MHQSEYGRPAALVLAHCESVNSACLTPASRASTVSSRSTPVGDLPYGASKGALDRITLAAAQELAYLGVAANAIDSGPTDIGWMTAEIKAAVLRSTPLGRLGRPQDCANLVAFLCSPDGGWIDGQLLRSDGGISLTNIAPSAAGCPAQLNV